MLEMHQPNPASGYRRIWLGVLVILAIAAVIYSRIDSRLFDRIGMTMADTAAPALEVVSDTSLTAKAAWTNLSIFLDQRNEVERLQQEIEELRGWRQAAQRLERENASLRALNTVSLPHRWRFITAKVIGGAHGPFLNSAVLDAGAASGIVDGSPVLDGNGLAGRVGGLGKRTSRVLFLTDLSSRVPVRLHPSGIQAVLAGDGHADPKLTLISNAESVRVGDEVFTSGSGGVFTAGLPIGRVTSIDAGEKRVSLAARYGDLTFVRVIDPTGATEIGNPGIVVKDPVPPDAE